jgi:SNF2 family DNA or RNA helicase
LKRSTKRFQFRDFQIDDLARAACLDGLILSWEQGLGKTLAALAWPQLKKARRTLIVAPGGLHAQFITEAAQKFKIHLRVLATHSDFEAYQLGKKLKGPPQYYIATYEAMGRNGADEIVDKSQRAKSRRMVWSMENKLRDTQVRQYGIGEEQNGIRCVWKPSLARLAVANDTFDCVVLDEATKIQNPTGLAAMAVRMLNPKYRLVLTGTPIKNRLQSIFCLAEWACRGDGRWPFLETDRHEFANSFLELDRYLTREETYRKKFKKSRKIIKQSARICNTTKLWTLLAPVVLRRTKKDCGETIVKKIVHLVPVPLGISQLAVYNQHLLNRPALSQAGNAINARTAAGMQLNALRIAALSPNSESLTNITWARNKPGVRSWTPWCPKLDSVLKVIRDLLLQGEQVLVGSPFQDFSHTLHALLQEATVESILLDGNVSPEERGGLAQGFKSGKYSVMVAGIKAMGEGHSFENCPNVILPSLSWAYDENEQFIHRVWRLTSPKTVHVWIISASGTVDELLATLYEEKKTAADSALDGRLLADANDFPEPEELLETLSAKTVEASLAVNESDLENGWELMRLNLREAQSAYWEMQAFDLQARGFMKAAVDALSLQSPTQLTVNEMRKNGGQLPNPMDLRKYFGI